jgi:hypothetical protein
MVKWILVAFVFFLLPRTGNAQLAVNLKAGVQANDLVVRNSGSRYSSGYQSGYSVHIGAYTMFNIGKKMNLIPELQLIHKTARVDGGGSPAIRLTYLELPFLFSYDITRWFAAEAGPSIGIKLTDNTPSKYFNAIDAGANLGLRIRMSSTWSLLARYYYGLASVDKVYWSGPGSGDMMRLYNQNFQLSATYSFE